MRSLHVALLVIGACGSEPPGSAAAQPVTIGCQDIVIARLAVMETDPGALSPSGRLLRAQISAQVLASYAHEGETGEGKGGWRPRRRVDRRPREGSAWGEPPPISSTVASAVPFGSFRRCTENR